MLPRMSKYVKYILPHLTEFLCAGVHFLQFLNALTCRPIAIFFERLIFGESFPNILISRDLMRQKSALWQYILKKYPT